jgi:hypothetical protein
MARKSAFIKAIFEAMGDTDIDFTAEYAEPGYSVGKGKKGIYFANWNDDSSDLRDLRKGLPEKWQKKTDKEIVAEIEKYAEIEWSDEWATCDDCGKAVRTGPNGWGWKPSYLIGDGECTCLECTDFAAHLAQHVNDPQKAWVYEERYVLEAGFEEISEESFHVGICESSEDPKAIFDRLKGRYKEIIFFIDQVEQFGMNVKVYFKGKKE